MSEAQTFDMHTNRDPDFLLRCADDEHGIDVPAREVEVLLGGLAADMVRHNARARAMRAAELARDAGEASATQLLHDAVDHPDYQVRKEAAFKLYQRGLREGVALANAAMDARS